MNSQDRQESSRLIKNLTLFFLPAIIAVELLNGNWLDPSSISKFNILRNVDQYIDVSDVVGEPGKVIHYKRDRHGFRGSYGEPSQIDIITLGSSTTDQRKLSEDETWQSVLSNEFRKDGIRLNIANAGVDGQTSIGFIRAFDVWFKNIKDIRSKFILVYSGSDEIRAQNDLPANTLADKSLGQFLKSQSIFYAYIRAFMTTELERWHPNFHRAHVDLNQVIWEEVSPRLNYRQIMEPFLRAYENRLQTLNQKIKDFGSKPIYVTQTRRSSYIRNGKLYCVRDFTFQTTLLNSKGANIDYQGVDAHYMAALINEVMMRVCREGGGICIDLDKEIVLENGDFYDYAHTNSTGSRKIGEYLHEKIKAYISGEL